LLRERQADGYRGRASAPGIPRAKGYGREVGFLSLALNARGLLPADRPRAASCNDAHQDMTKSELAELIRIA
jgi:hypothetical protein